MRPQKITVLRGRPSGRDPKPAADRVVTGSLVLLPATWAQVRRAAAAEGTTVTAWTRRAVERAAANVR